MCALSARFQICGTRWMSARRSMQQSSYTDVPAAASLQIDRCPLCMCFEVAGGGLESTCDSGWLCP